MTAKVSSDKANSGFTLIEIAIAITILVIMTSITYSAVTQVLRSKIVLDDKRDLNAVAYSLLNRLGRELQLAYSGIGLLPRPDDSNQTQQPSTINLIGEPSTLSNGRRGDSIRFLALEGGQYLPDGGTHSGLVQIMYRVEENPEAKNLEIPTYVLVREETPVIRPFEKAFSKTMIFPAVESLLSLQFRYRNASEQQWAEKWGVDDNNRLPSEIEIRLELLSPNNEIRSFVTSVPIRSIN